MYVIRLSFFLTLSFRWKRKRGLQLFPPTLRLISAAAFLSWMVCSWKEYGCPGFPDCYLCRPFSYRAFFNEHFVEEATSVNDYRRLVDINNFEFLLNPSPCENKSLLVMVHSAPYNFDKRQTIRYTWGSLVDDRYRLIFLLGVSNNSSLEAKLKEESRFYKDIVQGSFIDAYRNLTYKHVMGFKWKEYFCPKVLYVLKTDDDVFVNLPVFLANLKTIPWDNINCFSEARARTKRTSRSKWRITNEEYPFRFYPTFCQGYVIFYQSKAVSKLYSVAQVARWFWVDDVFVTGILAAAAGVEHSKYTWNTMSFDDLSKILSGTLDSDKFLAGPPNLDALNIRKLWARVKKNKRIANFSSLN